MPNERLTHARLTHARLPNKRSPNSQSQPILLARSPPNPERAIAGWVSCAGSQVY
ncbi:MAG: hypothetical protein F6K30_19565 [Cyanothece sp. SIO2G6]|nr:hypothetical protein [Cyanothece sp. SIO2G6]